MWNERLVSVIRSLFLFFTSFYFFFKFYVLFASRLFFSPSLFKFDMTWMRQCIRFFWLRRPMSISRHIAVDRISSPQWYPSKNAIIGSIQKSLLFFFFFLLLYIISPKNKKWLFNFFLFKEPNWNTYHFFASTDWTDCCFSSYIRFFFFWPYCSWALASGHLSTMGQLIVRQ